MQKIRFSWLLFSMLFFTIAATTNIFGAARKSNSNHVNTSRRFGRRINSSSKNLTELLDLFMRERESLKEQNDSFFNRILKGTTFDFSSGSFNLNFAYDLHLFSKDDLDGLLAIIKTFNIQSLNLSGIRHPINPGWLPISLKELVVDSTSARNIPKTLAQDCPHLESLSLAEISDLNDDFLMSLPPSLLHLNLDDAAVTHLPAGFADRYSKLESLAISNDSDDDLPPFVFQQGRLPTRLKILKLTGQKILNLPAWFAAAVPHLEELDLCFNLDLFIGRGTLPQSIKKLILINTSMSEFPSQALNLLQPGAYVDFSCEVRDVQTDLHSFDLSYRVIYTLKELKKKGVIVKFNPRCDLAQFIEYEESGMTRDLRIYELYFGRPQADAL